MKKRILFATHEDLSKTAVARSMFLDVASSMSDEYGCTILSGVDCENQAKSDGVDHLNFKRAHPGSVSLRDAWSMLQFILKNRSTLSKFDIYYVRSYPAMLIFALLGRHFSIPVIFDTRGLFFHELFDSNKIKSKRLLPLLVKLEKWLLRTAKVIICVTEAQMQYYLSMEPDRQKYHLIYNSAPLPSISPVEPQPGAPLTIAYLGSMGVWHLPEKINLIVDHLRKLIPGLKFHCITPDVEQAKSIFSTHEDTLIYSHSFRYNPKKFDFAFCLIKDSFSKRVCFPVKLCEYLAAQTPVIFSDNVDVCNALNNRLHFGVPVNIKDSPETIAQQIFESLPRIRQMTVSLPDELNFNSLVAKAAVAIKSA